MAALAADRNLLFGLIALQNGLIVQDQLLGAFRAWTLDKAHDLADHLVGRGDLDSDQRAGVEAMVGLHLKKHGGSAEKSLAAIPAGRSTRESLAAPGDPAMCHRASWHVRGVCCSSGAGWLRLPCGGVRGTARADVPRPRCPDRPGTAGCRGRCRVARVLVQPGRWIHCR